MLKTLALRAAESERMAAICLTCERGADTVQVARALAQWFGSVDAIRAATRDELAAVDGVGGIIADSNPASEYQETLDKAEAIFNSFDSAAKIKAKAS